MDKYRAGVIGLGWMGMLYDLAPFRKAYEPGHKFADPDGYVQYTNINPAMEMINDRCQTFCGRRIRSGN